MMRKLLVLAMFLALPVLAVASDDYRLFYTEYSIAYTTTMSPSSLENNSTGLLDTPAFNAAVGFNVYEWVNVYAGAGFMFFPYAKDMQKHISYIPVYGGIKLNVLPENTVFASVFAEAGMSVSNYHRSFMGQDIDYPWTGAYLNYGIAVNYKLNDIASLVLRLEMPSIEGKDSVEDIKLFRSSLGWKVIY